jgi:hypothetical protein
LIEDLRTCRAAGWKQIVCNCYGNCVIGTRCLASLGRAELT